MSKPRRVLPTQDPASENAVFSARSVKLEHFLRSNVLAIITISKVSLL